MAEPEGILLTGISHTNLGAEEGAEMEKAPAQAGGGEAGEAAATPAAITAGEVVAEAASAEAPDPEPQILPSLSASSTSDDDAVEVTAEPFVNMGLKRWLAAREAWCRAGSTSVSPKKEERKSSFGFGAFSRSISPKPPKKKQAVPVDVDSVIDVLFDPRWRGGHGPAQKAKLARVPPRFPTNVPLPQMIDVLTDLWEAEGLDV